MQTELERLFYLISSIPVEAVYLLVAVGAAIENVFPPVPSDTVVLLGAILAERGILRADIVFLVAWLSNVVLALGVYLAGRKYGRGIFSTRWGRWLLRPHQLRQLSVFYERYGMVTVLVSRFFPVFRVLIPAFAGISKLGFWRTAVPLAIASGVWYATLVLAGVLASRNLGRLISMFERVNTGLLGAAGLLLAAFAVWWWLSRRERHRAEETAPDEEATDPEPPSSADRSAETDPEPSSSADPAAETDPEPSSPADPAAETDPPRPDG